jgi:signal transduction histidine kinase
MSLGSGSVDPGFQERRRSVGRPWVGKGRILLVENDEFLRESIALVMDENGYEVASADNGRDALAWLYVNALPNLIVLDLKMPVMDGWEFRMLQKDDPKLGVIPVVAISADGSAQSAAISAAAYLRKPVEANELLSTIERVLFEHERKQAARVGETERLAALGRMAAGIGHEINNPLSFVLLNLTLLIDRVRPSLLALGMPSDPPLSGAELDAIRTRLAAVPEMLEECRVGGERIRETVGNLQRLSRQDQEQVGPVDIQKILEQSVSMVWNQIRHRAHLIKVLGKLPCVRGNASALGQVFLNLLVNAAQAMPEGDTTANEIRIRTEVVATPQGSEVVVEIADTGKGIAPEILAHVFEPFYTTKPIGQGTGLGLSISRQTVNDHGGRLTVESKMGKGTVFRVFLPVGDLAQSSASGTRVADGGVPDDDIPSIDTGDSWLDQSHLHKA